jgi:hypothetical protein
MLKNLLNYYKLPMLLSVSVSIAFVALKLLRDPIAIGFVLAGALLGTFFLDLDYILHAYILDPDSDFSKTIKGYIHHKDFKGLVTYLFYHRTDLKEKTLSSAVFQVVLAGASLLVVSSTASNFSKAFVLSAYVNSMYRFAEEHLQNKNTKEWFWAFKVNADKKFVSAYSIVLGVVLIFSLLLL